MYTAINAARARYYNVRMPGHSLTRLGGDNGLAGWTITAENDQGQIVSTAVTGSDGTYTLTLVQGTYTIAEVRYREGISTQLELSESRLLLEQSRANRAMAARNLQVARMRLALLKDLPLGSGGLFGGSGTGGASGAGGVG